MPICFIPFDEKLNENLNPNKRYVNEDSSIMVSLVASTKQKAVEMAYQQISRHTPNLPIG